MDISQWDQVFELVRSVPRKDVVQLGRGMPDVDSPTLKPLLRMLARRWRQPSSSAALSLQTRERLLQSVDQWAQDNSTTPLRIDSLCEALEVPIWQLERAFLQTYGMAPQRLITLRREKILPRNLLVPIIHTAP